ncbi:MAG: glycosyltransferase family 39 protein [Micropruina sp.]|uniref:glycosyltransferase family 39 protein n=1 Tax=Micropruina sp. TaxID=2737536 RepID=UPI0039E25E6D
MIARPHASLPTLSIATGLVGLLVSLIGIDGPLPWRDEAATWIANERSLSALRAMLSQIDAVHGVYYLGMRAWVHIFGSSILSLRLVSALGIGIATALVTVLAARIGSRSVGPSAGLIFAILPQATWAGAEARSFAISTTLGVAAMAAFWKASSDGRVAWWALYSILAAASVYLFLYVALIYVAVPLTLIWMPRAQQIRGLIASLIAGLLATPLALLAIRQTAQVSWLERYPVTPVQVLQGAFWGVTPTSFLGSILLIAALVNAVRLCLSAESRSKTIFLVAWLVLPTAILMLMSLRQPMYTERYVTASAPALAILLALLIDWLRSYWLKAITTLLLLATAIPALWISRQPEAHITASAVAAKLAELTQPGDNVYIVNNDRHVLWWAFHTEMDGLINLGEQRTDRWKQNRLKQPSLRVDQIRDRLEKLSHLWVFADRGRLGSSISDFERFGFAEASRVKVTEGYPVTLVLMRRPASR